MRLSQLVRGVWGQPKLICFPYAGGQGKDGVQRAPNALLHELPTAFAGLEQEELEPRLSAPNAAFDRTGGARALHETLRASHLLADAVRKTASLGKNVLSLGGDHSMALGSVAGMLDVHPDLHVLWVDAHADLNRPTDSDSGNMHGMPLSFLTGLETETKVPFLRNTLPFAHLHYVGLRSVDGAEAQAIADKDIDALSAGTANAMGAERLTAHLDARISDTAPLHISFDVDCLDPKRMPCTGTPVDGGLRLSLALALVEWAVSRKRLLSVDLTEVNLHLGTEEDKELSLETLSRLLDHLLPMQQRMAVRN